MTEDLRVWVHSRHPRTLGVRLSPHQPLWGYPNIIITVGADKEVACKMALKPEHYLNNTISGWRWAVAQAIRHCRKELRNA